MSPSPQSPESESPVTRDPVFTRGDRKWALCYLIVILVLWLANFLSGLNPVTFGGLGMLAVFGLLLLPYALILGLLLAAITGPFFEICARRKLARFFGRLGLAAVGIAFFGIVFTAGGGPWGLGQLCGAKWSLGLDAIRRLEASPEVISIGQGEQVRILDPVPGYLRSSYWGEPAVSVQPRLSGPPEIRLMWGGGFSSWGIVVGPGGKCSLSAEDYNLTPWTDDIWLFRER